MEPLQWLPSFNLGVSEIDDDHRELFDIVVSIKEALDLSDFQKSSALIDRFMDRATLHFDQEEQFLEKVKFDNLEKHKQYHRSLLLQAKAMRVICRAETEKKDIEKCYLELCSILFDDIVRGDLEFKSFLDYHNYS